MINKDPNHKHTYDAKGNITCCSLEEKIANLKIKKQTAFDRLFDADEESVEAVSRESNYSLSKDDFIYLLKSE